MSDDDDNVANSGDFLKVRCDSLNNMSILELDMDEDGEDDHKTFNRANKRLRTILEKSNINNTKFISRSFSNIKDCNSF